MLNKVELIGRLGKDPEIKHLDSGQVMARFSIATTETFKDRDGEKKETTEWHNVVVWGKQAETAEKFLTKGKLIYLEGSIRTRKWEDKEGQTKYTTEIHVRNFIFLPDGSKKTTAPAAEEEVPSWVAKPEPAAVKSTFKDAPQDDLPF